MQKNDMIVFYISESEYIVFDLDGEAKSELCVYLFTIITFYGADHTTYDLLDDYAAIGLEYLQFLLKKVLNNELNLHQSIDQDIGYLWNKHLMARANHDGPGKFPSWDGDVYNLWASSRYCKDCCATWLYEKDGKIIFEITSMYRWIDVDPEPGESYITYEEFMENYKPLIIREISRDLAQKWLTQTNELIELMEKNTQIHLQDAENKRNKELQS